MTQIPFTKANGLPDYKNIEIDKIVDTITATISRGKDIINSLCEINESPTWENFGQPLDDLSDYEGKVVGPISHLTAVQDSPDLRQAWKDCLPLLVEYGSFIGQHQRLFERYVAFCDGDEFNNLTTAQQKSVTNSIRSFELSGISLEDEKRERFNEITKQLSELTNKFSDNVLDATQYWTHHVQEKYILFGVPKSTMDFLKQSAEEEDLDGWLITLNHPSYGPVLQYAHNRKLREMVYRASVTKASDQGITEDEQSFDNTKIMDSIMELRFEQAKLLGYDTPADLSLVTKMAESPAKVMSFLTDLIEKGRPKAETDNEELKAFARNKGYNPMMPWDRAYCVEQLQQSKYNLSDEEARQYFPDIKVIEGMFKVVKQLYGLDVMPESGVDTWHDDVMCYKILENNVKIASFYMDIYARSDKRGGAWMNDAIGLRRIDDDKSSQLPVAYLNCNFTPPTDGKPSLLTHYEVETLFHEFGHCLHHMLTEIETGDVSGINGVNWDAVELPSQIMEYWCWNREALNMISSHHETGEPIPDELFAKMIAAKNFMSGTQLLRQMNLSLYDFKIHMEFNEDTPLDNIQYAVDYHTSLEPKIHYNRWQNSFSHIFAGGYSAGYFSYSWAETLAADAFSEFEKNGIFDKDTGQRFRDCILSKGGSKDAMELFVDFMGREPSSDNMLRQKGIID